MVVRTHKFTPEILLSAPRRSSAVPNKAGTLALYSVSTYSFQNHKKSTEICILDLETGEDKVLSSETKASEPTWFGDENHLLFLKSEEKGTTSLNLINADKPDEESQTLIIFDGPVSNLKATKISEKITAIALTGSVTAEGELYNPEKAKKPLSSARVYTKLFVRQWDSYVTENKNTIWYTTLTKSQGFYKIAPLKNALSGCALPLESPVPPFGGTCDFDISKNGLVFIAKDPKIDPANFTKTDLYYVPLKTFEENKAPSPKLVRTGDLEGYSNCPVFSPDAKSVVFTRMKSNVYESDKPRLILIPDIMDVNNFQEFFKTENGEGGWDLRPENISWSLGGEVLYVTAEENGRGKLFKIPCSPFIAKDLPVSLINDGNVIDVKNLPNNNILISSSSLVDCSTYSILNPEEPNNFRVISSASKAGQVFGLSKNQVEEIWFKGAEDYNVHAWIVKPSSFDNNKKYPLAYLIHGGPQGAWTDSWSTRWNPAVFAEQGYVVVTPNPTGSTGYGMEFQNGIRNNWGGRPYVDLVKGFEYIKTNLTYIDTSRAVALGASYGGYMINWIQGHDFGRNFKCLVTHDGVFSTLNQIASDEQFFPRHDFGGPLWENRETYEKWDPARYLKNWATPHLIIHNELDYRLPISEGIAPFNVLQSKGVESRFLSFPNENHWVLNPENSLVWYKEVLDWINKYSGITNEQEALRRGISKIFVSTSQY
ncbi:Dipeptidyl-peptidase 5 [Golovinomyces cichoracearum]|uniref:Dipeptidyl-peptidase V n=1 Tax=Golovinomyces cichoracearum TaxID=62708 RepID=A0A420IAW9_9PEZI|nr:Dipeptidyl-peptidase 5 [Golovinomyces cichoracearum]